MRRVFDHLPVALATTLAVTLSGCGDSGGGTETTAPSAGPGSDPSTFGTEDTTDTAGTEPTGGSDGSSTESSSTTAGPTSTATSTATSTGPSGCVTDDDCPDGVCLDGGVCSLCEPGSTRGCYTGPDGTLGNGACAEGSETCEAGGDAWGPCLGEVLPLNEVCGNELDDNCNGEVDEDVDADGDGWFACAGDCCDTEGAVCQKPELVNPGAYEVEGNDVDDDCDGEKDEAEPLCDGGIATNSGNPDDYARAMDLCQFTTENPPDPNDKVWGVIDAGFSLADGEGAPKAAQRAVRPVFGDNIDPEGGQSMAVLSSGAAASTGQTSPGYAGFQIGVNHGTTSPPPSDWFAANGGMLPNPMGCQEPGDITPNDPIMLTLRIRAPTNALSFAVKMFFFSAEYPEWVCSEFNDFFVALVDSKAVDNPDGQEHRHLRRRP